MSKDEPSDVADHLAGQVRQLLAERANAVAYEMTDRVKSIDLQLVEFGYDPKKVEKVARDTPPQDRRAAHETTEKAGGDKSAVSEHATLDKGPAGRHVPGKPRS